MVKHLTVKQAMQDTSSRHVLGLSGGKDSAALAVHIRDNYPELHEKMEYFFSDTGAELSEVYDFLGILESYLGKEIIRIGSERPFEHWLKVNNDFLPSPRQRWCTVNMKLKPFENFVGNDEVISYIGIRADEHRDGYVSTKPNIKAVFPFKDDDLERADIYQILEDSVGIPKYYEWRSRSGCYFCFFQRRDEWLGLKRYHPELFEKAKEIERKSGNGYTWVQGMTLDEVVELAEKKEKEKGLIFSDKTPDKQKWQRVLENMEEDDADDQACIICSL
ncbi:phosphoadenosine phosphosulfate reductase family protein [Pseudoalteromonas sp. OANN1]|uniref:phosphoadenosine phosphosulfate reductase domain-containing protein n=1 Tax=Pseudoalteromonas sp. OANN1 TaxID=2954497 RepID=UPI002097E285|nr:phosphoadenosine phosphosulfate reductase family protein [Pseudoalteromonas sp. OANN1]MCO7199598.1 phosphoadenosine phosphosulfate reductase family protein [Pseudoalteromonas sp. OANN1]